MRDILIQSGTIAEGSVDKAVFGKMYNRGIRAYKIVYEAIVRKIFEEIGLNDDGKVLDFDITNTTFDEIRQDETLTTKVNKFVVYWVSMEGGQPLQQFWMSFLDGRTATEYDLHS